MTLLATVVALGAIIGVAAGGDLANIATYRLRAWPLILAAVALEATLGGLPSALRWVAALAACGATVGWCVLNSRTRPFPAGPDLVGAGAALNALVMAANHGMPVSAAALGRAGLPPALDVSRGHLYKHVAMTPHTVLAALGDVIPVAPLTAVISAGDVVMLVGIALGVARATRPPGPAWDGLLAAEG